MRVYVLPGCGAGGLLSRAGPGSRNGRLSLCLSARKPARKLNITVLPRLRANCCAEVMAHEWPASCSPRSVARSAPHRWYVRLALAWWLYTRVYGLKLRFQSQALRFLHA